LNLILMSHSLYRTVLFPLSYILGSPLANIAAV